MIIEAWDTGAYRDVQKRGREAGNRNNKWPNLEKRFANSRPKPLRR